MLLRKISFNFLSLLFITLLLALLSPSTQAETTTPWQVEIAPYFWAINMNGHVQVGSQAAHISESFSEILKQFKGGGMLWIDAHNDKFGLFLNSLYTVLSQQTQAGLFNINTTNKYGLFSAGASYDIYDKIFANQNELVLAPYVGVRYTLNNTTVKVSVFNIDLSASNNQNWLDPIIGLRLRYHFNKAWHALVAGDIGGTNFKDHNSYNIYGLIGYNPQTKMKNATFYLGYRLLYQNYVTGSGRNYYAWDMKLFGPMLGVAIAL